MHHEAKPQSDRRFALGGIIGGAVVQTLHAQAKPKAYSVIELEPLDSASIPSYVRAAEAAQDAAGVHQNFYTGRGRVVGIVGTAPKRVVILEWNSLQQAQDFYASHAWNDLAPQRDKAFKMIRLYAVEGAPPPAVR